MGNKAFIFDLDDTLYKERDYRASGYRIIARCFAAACGMSPELLYYEMMADPTQAFERVMDLAAKYGVSVTIDTQLSVYRSQLPDIAIDDNTCAVLEELRRRGYLLGIITDGRPVGQLNKLAALQVTRFFDPEYVIPTALFNSDKTEETPFAMMEARMEGVCSFTYVGDNPFKDFHYPNLRGWDTVMLADPEGVNIHHQRLEEYPRDFRPKRIIHSLSELL